VVDWIEFKLFIEQNIANRSEFSMNQILKIFLVTVTSVAGLVFVVGCSSHPVLPQTKDIKVSRDNPSKSCQDLGLVEGRTLTNSGSTEEALEDMKKDAVKKGANYIKMETMGAMGTSVRGTAYFCN
jgi:hypothetical protein